MIFNNLLVTEVKICHFSYCTLKDFVILPFQTLTAMSNAVEIVGILDFADDISWSFKNI
jgi:hypothetical protein